MIGACNPYRILSEKNKKLELGLKRSKKEKNLVYTVNPLPHSLLNFVIDFGELSKEDTEKYIMSMLEKEIIDFKHMEENVNNKPEKEKFEVSRSFKEIKEDNELLNKAVKAVKECHFFIKEKGDVSGVSLRDLKYFVTFYHSFRKYFEYLKQLFTEKKKNKQFFLIDDSNTKHLKEISEMPEKSFKEHAINLSIYISYYLRLPTKDLRKELCQKLKEKKIFQYDFLVRPEKESKYILDQININPQRGIAKNTALRENIFCELFCLINKIPLIICGKPGNSKSLSVQLLLDSMKGKSSTKEFFKNPAFKEVIMYPFQGSATCTTKGVLKTFNKARNFIKKNNDMTSLVFFDEMGLAEDSPENPLKVLHAELEKENDKVAFFGLTNWALDASKMNRGIRNSSQDPDEEDLIMTGTEIAKSVDEKNVFKDNEKLFTILSRTYFDYRNKKAETGYKDFHGNRDFYHLIRNTMKYLKESKNKDNNIDFSYIRTISAIKGLERNFGGFENSVKDIIEIFYKKSEYYRVEHKYDIIKCINDNLKDPYSRYLLLVSKNSTSQNLIKQIIKKEQKQNVTYIGSPFKGDKSEIYTEELLYKIQMQMKNEVILILKGLEIIYPSLYDLFNQNFSEFNGKKCAKISFANNQSTYLVNDNFKVIVLIDEQMMGSEDKPFLNRFEKHIISFENILTPMNIKLVQSINKKLDDLIKNENLNIYLKNQLINCDKEIIENLVFDLSQEVNKNNKKTEEDYEKEIFKLIAPTLTQDIISCFNINGFMAKEPAISEIIKQAYNESHVNNITQYLKKITEKTTDLRHIIYTFSNITEPIFKDSDFKVRNTYGSNSLDNSMNSNDFSDSFFNKQKTIEIVIGSIEKEKDLELRIEQFYKGNRNLCVIKFEEEDLNKMNFVKNVIEEMEEMETMNKNTFKYFLFIVYMKRYLFSDDENNKINNTDNSIIKDQIPLNSDFSQITIDNLNNNNIDYNIFDLISNNDNINNIINISKIIEENIYNCIDTFNLLFKNKKKDFKEIHYKEEISESIKNEEYLSQKIKDLIIKNCPKILDIITNVLTKDNIIHQDNVDLLTVIEDQYKKEVISTLKKAFYILEKNQNISSYLLSKNTNYNTIIDFYLENIDFHSIPLVMKLNITLGLRIPNIKANIQELKKYIKENVLEKYINNENMLRNDLPDDDEQKWKNKYKKQKTLLEVNTKNQISKIKGLDNILKTKDISIIKDFFNDLYIIFLSANYPTITETIINFLDTIIQIYILNANILINKEDFKTTFAEKLVNKHEDEIKDNNLEECYNDIVKVFLFLESYSDFIYYMIDIFWEINQFSPKVETEFILAFTKEKFVYEKGERAPEYFAEVNFKLFQIYESIIYSMKKILYDICKEKDNLTKYIQFIKSNMVKMRQINSEYSFFSKEIFILQNLIFILRSLEKGGNKFDNNDIITISQLLDNERDYINKNNQNELRKNLEKIRVILIKNLGENTEEYANIFINILLNEYKIFESDDHRLQILDMICGNNKLITKSLPILEYLFGRLTPKELNKEEYNDVEEGNAFIEIFTKEYIDSKIYKYIDKQTNNTLQHVLLYLFEYKIEKYFFKLRKKYNNDNKTYINKIFNSSAFIYFKKAVETYIQIERNEFSEDEGYVNLLKIYSIAYIKRYIEHYINLKL